MKVLKAERMNLAFHDRVRQGRAVRGINQAIARTHFQHYFGTISSKRGLSPAQSMCNILQQKIMKIKRKGQQSLNTGLF